MVVVTIVICVLLTVATYFFINLVMYGRRLHHGGRPHNAYRVSEHTRNLRGIDISLGLGVLGIEVLVRMSAHPYAHPLLLGIHLSFVAVFFISYLSIRIWFDGQKAPVWHARLAYTCLASLVAAFCTSIVLYKAL